MTKHSAHYAWIQMRCENFPHRVWAHLGGARIPPQRAPAIIFLRHDLYLYHINHPRKKQGRSPALRDFIVL